MVDTQTTQTTAVRHDGFLARHWQKLVAAAIWLTLAGGFIIFAGNFSISAINPWTLALSAVLFVAGLAVSRLLRRKEQA